MANLVVTFRRAQGTPPVMVGRNARTESVAIGGTSAPTTMVCDPSDNNQESIADLYAAAACWVKIGDGTPVATANGTSAYMAEGERLQFTIVKGDRVAVIQA